MPVYAVQAAARSPVTMATCPQAAETDSDVALVLHVAGSAAARAGSRCQFLRIGVAGGCQVALL